jgi:hypothetical protein
MQQQGSGYLARPAPSGLADVVDMVLTKGIVVDVYARVSLLGIEVLTLDARVVVTSVDTYLRFAEATHRLDLSEQGGKSPAEMLTKGAGAAVEKVATTVVERKVEGVIDTVEEGVGGAVGKVADTVEDAAEAVTDKVGEVVDKIRSDE